MTLLCALAFLAIGCGNGGSGSGDTSPSASSGEAKVQPPSSIADSGEIVYCSDMTYPPLEFIENETPTGADIELGDEIASLLGVEPQFQQTGFEGIIAALEAGKCDGILSAMTNNEERREVISFVNYAEVGQSLMVAKGNPLQVNSLQSLSGKAVSVLVGTLNKTLLDKVNEELSAEGSAPIDIVTFPKDTDAVNSLRTGRVDGYLSDAPVVAYYVHGSPDTFEIAGEQLAVAPYGVGIRKDDSELQKAVSTAIRDLYASGKMERILDKWSLGQTALKE
jgi:polar amino acid transport system substrate-binding protein